jgi:MSHA biogenesis protein MshK
MRIANPILLFVAAIASAGAQAQALTDPTRPPAAVLAAQARGPSAGAGVEASPAADPAPKLQMLRIGPSQEYALIGGRVVRLGGTVDGAKLVEIRRDAVVLQPAEGGRETISLYPGIRIRLVTAPPSGETPDRGGNREGASKRDKK